MKLEIYNNIADINAVRELALKYRDRGKKVVFTNGCFDVLHAGHLRYLQKARKLGDVLFIGLNSDASVKRLKGNSRPIIQCMERAELLLGFSCVDHVIVFEEDTPENLIKIVNPQILVKGGDWDVKDIVGSTHVIKNGGSVKTIEYEEGHSTSEIIEKIVQLSKTSSKT